jgi:hypothetical protein
MRPPPRHHRVFRCFVTRQEVYKRAMARRPLLDDETFYSTFYARSEVPREVAGRLRHLFAYQLGSPWERLRPRDLIHRVDNDIDFAEVVFEAEEEFGVSVPMAEIRQLNGSFDGLVRCIAQKLIHQPAPRH